MASIAEVALEELRLFGVKDAARTDPKALINEIKFFDPSQADDEEPSWIEFKMFPPDGWEAPVVWLPNNDLEFSKVGAEDWFWQSVVIDWLHSPEVKRYLIYKARQLGITLLACAYALWLMLFRPGSASLAYSYTEDEAVKLVVASWAMYRALPDILKSHVRVIAPKSSEEPTEWIKLLHQDGRISTFQALPATKKHGHGSRATFIIMDEVARQDYARQIYTAAKPATTRGRAKLMMISTADGVSNLETGEGNFFHHLWATRKEKKLSYVFLPWDAEPTRGEEWYEDEAMALPEVERNQQYPKNEEDGFMLSGALYFDRAALEFYKHQIRDPLHMGQFALQPNGRYKFLRFRDGVIQILEEPRPNAAYVIGVDTATGSGADYTSMDVLDLSSGAPVAHLHAKLESPRAAEQLHFLGRMYNMALVGIERQGGYGEALIIAMRDGTRLFGSYPNLYRHKQETKVGKPKVMEYGYPMTGTARAQALGELYSWIRQRLFPWLTAGHHFELRTFVHQDTKPTPRAQEGMNDDRVLSLAIAVELYRQRGDKPERSAPRKPAKRRRREVVYTPHPAKAGIR